MEAQDGEDPRTAETRPKMAEKKPTKGSNETHDGEGKQREQLGRIHRRGWRSLHVSEHDERTSLA